MTLNSGPHIVGLNRRIEELEDELQLARDRVKELEAALGIGDDLLPLRLMGFAPQEAAIVNLLLCRDFATKPQVLQVMYGADPERRFDVQAKIADTLVHHTRRKLARLGVKVETMPGWTGYRMLGPDKSRLKLLMASKAFLATGEAMDRRHRANRVIGVNRRQRASTGVSRPLRAAE